jgi:two-component system, NarL family, response regulator NreC
MSVEMNEGKVRLMLADDHTILRAGLKALLSLNPDFEVVAEADDGREAIDKALAFRPDVVVMDISMPRLNGLEATREIVGRLPDTKVLILTAHSESEYLLQVLEAGGSGYVQKKSADRDLVEAIHTVHRGEVFLYPSAARLVLESVVRHPEAHDQAARATLSEREEAVLKLTAEGYSNREIAGQLYLSSKTVDTYRQRIMEKLNLHHRTELVRYALEAGLLRP